MVDIPVPIVRSRHRRPIPRKEQKSVRLEDDDPEAAQCMMRFLSSVPDGPKAPELLACGHLLLIAAGSSDASFRANKTYEDLVKGLLWALRDGRVTWTISLPFWSLSYATNSTW